MIAMETHSEINDALRKELGYYKSQVDVLTAAVINLEYQLAEMSNEITQLRQGLGLIAALQDFPSGRDLSGIYEHFTEQINLQLQMDRSAILLPVPGRDRYFAPAYLTGYSEMATSLLAEEQIYIPEDFLSQTEYLLVNSQTERTPFIDMLTDKLKLRYFILTPIIIQRELLAFLVTGRNVERIPLASSKLLIHDVHAMEAISGVIAAIRNQHDRLRLLETERARIAREMHDDIGAGLTHIAMVSEGLHHNETQKISTTARELVQSMGEIIWALNPEHDTLESLLIYLREQLHKFLEPFDVDYTIDFPTTVPHLNLKHMQRRNIYLTIKEASNNAMKYASAGTLQIASVIEGDELKFVVRDNGRGFERDAVNQTANGLRNMQRRMEEIGAKLQITSAPGQGTTVECSFSLHQAENGAIV